MPNNDISDLFKCLIKDKKGEIFVANLFRGIESNLIDAKAFFDHIKDFSGFDRNNPDEILAVLSILLKKPNCSVYKKHCKTKESKTIINSTFSGFNVLRSDSMKRHYIADKDLFKKMAFPDKLICKVSSAAGEDVMPEIIELEKNAATQDGFWVAPVTGDTGDRNDIKEGNAEKLRDDLGLVHLGASIHLYAMVFNCSSLKCYKPTVVEAMPNSRFCHHDDDQCFHGYTIELSSVKTAKVIDELKCFPELYCDGIELAEMSTVKFIYLGKTENNRATEDEDQKYLELLLDGLAMDNVIDQLLEKVA